MVTHSASAAPLKSDSDHNAPLPELEFELVSIADLASPQRAVRKLNNHQIEKCIRSIERFGFKDPILIRCREIVDGLTRVEALRQLGATHVPCIRVDDLDDKEIRALRIALNKIQETGVWDEEVLKLELAYQLEFNTDLTDLGFEPPELDAILEIEVNTFNEADPADSLQEAGNSTVQVSREGDIWRAGDHLITCSSARDARLIDTLVDHRSVRLVLTDPPYNVPVKGHIRVKDGRFEEFAEASGEMSRKVFTEFLRTILGNAAEKLVPGGLIYAFMDWRHNFEIQSAFEDLGLEILNLCVWVKPNGGMGSFYRSRHELVFVGKVPGAPHTNNVELGSNGRYRTNVWEYAGATGGAKDEADDFALHPTVKPIRLIEDVILDASAVGETVFDPFLGSGTTLLAAERTKRRCAGIDIAPVYVDVAIRRWEAMTGRDAVHAQSGQTFREREAIQERSNSSAEPSTEFNSEGEF